MPLALFAGLGCGGAIFTHDSDASSAREGELDLALDGFLMAMQSTDESLLRSLERGGLIDITTTGRRTGEPRRLEIAFHNIAGRFYISGIPSRTRRSWLANLEAEPRLTLHLKRGVKADLPARARIVEDRKSTRLNSSHTVISYAVFCLKKKKTTQSI